MSDKRFAFNVADALTIRKHCALAYACTIGPLLTDAYVQTDPTTVDGMAVVLNGDATEERLWAIREVLALKGYKRGLYRVYQEGARGGWRPLRLPAKWKAAS